MLEVKTIQRSLLLRHKENRVSRHPYLRGPSMHRVIIAQLSATIFLSITFLSFSKNAAVSAFLGGLCCSIPNAYFIWKAFRYKGASAAQQIVSSFYQGEAGKFVLTVLAFVMVFTLIKPIMPVALFSAFFIVQSIHWLTPLLIEKRQRKHSN
ncbi:MAG: F0F1 ATP synthase subunit I [Endozoicomonas sp. (ex Botrylloides leachii)]|nr:F0F1 ATP synthase subunit I [Endozoicomonas sp. (ex Botrylloides leachii)]